MRFRSALLLAALIGPAVAQTPTDESNLLIGPLAVFLRGDSTASPGVLTAMRREVEAIVVPAGIHLTWNSGPDSAVYSRIVVMRLQGQCRPETAIQTDRRVAEPLGQTQVVDGKVIPFADVRCDSVRRVIDRDLRAATSADREELLGRALGRVMAHELYHVLLRTRKHGHSGLARPVLTSADLLAVHDNFASSDERRLAESLGADAAASGVGTVTQGAMLYIFGRATDTATGAPVQNVTVFVDRNSAGTATLGLALSDVANAFGRSDYTNGGWSFQMPTNPLSLGQHTVTATAAGSSGTAPLLGSRTVNVQ
jgi:hypothetical protein